MLTWCDDTLNKNEINEVLQMAWIFLGLANDSQANDNHAFDFSVSLGLSL